MEEKTSKMMRFEWGDGVTVHWAAEEGKSNIRRRKSGYKGTGVCPSLWRDSSRVALSWLVGDLASHAKEYKPSPGCGGRSEGFTVKTRAPICCLM